MSYTELYYVTPKMRVVDYKEFHNSHLGASLVWHNMFTMHCSEWRKKKAEERGYVLEFPADDDDYKQVWHLFSNPDIPECERAVLGSTFDFVILKKEHFPRFTDDVYKYCVTYRAGTLLQQVAAINELSKRKIVGVCWNQTSVSAGMGRDLKRKAKARELWSLYDNMDVDKQGEKA